MFIAAAVHKYTFGWETYADGTFQLLMTERKKAVLRLERQNRPRTLPRQPTVESPTEHKGPDSPTSDDEHKDDQLVHADLEEEKHDDEATEHDVLFIDEHVD